MEPHPALAPYARTVTLPGDGLKTFLYDSDAGPHAASQPEAAPVMLVHGLGDEADTWRRVLPELAQRGYRAVAPDLPGFGRSDKPKRAYTLDFYADTLLRLIDALGFPQATLAGHSLGAIICHWTALAAPERVARLVLVSGSLVARPGGLDLATIAYLVPGLGEWKYNRLRGDPDAAFDSLGTYYADMPEADREFLYRRVNQRVWSNGQRDAFLSTLRNLVRMLPAQNKTLPARLAALEVPTVAVWGELDRVNSAENGKLLTEKQPGVRLTLVPGAGHNIHQEQPEAVLAAITEQNAKP
jgi:pimeloyl-ACP methyl ester carboxylesterase